MKSCSSHHLFMPSTKAGKRNEQWQGFAGPPEEESPRRLLGLRRKMTGSTLTEDKRYVKPERRQKDSVGGNGGGVHSSSQKHPRQIDNCLPPKISWKIKDGMGKNKGLVKSCPKRYYMERGPTSCTSHLASQTCKIQ